MTPLLILISAVAVAIVVLSVRVPLGGRLDLAGALGATVVVHTADGSSIRGTLVGAGPIALQDAAYLQDGAEHPIGGTVLIPSGQVAWAQSLPPDLVRAA